MIKGEIMKKLKDGDHVNGIYTYKNKKGFFRITGEEEPVKENDTKVCGGCGEIYPVCYCELEDE